MHRARGGRLRPLLLSVSKLIANFNHASEVCLTVNLSMSGYANLSDCSRLTAALTDESSSVAALAIFAPFLCKSSH